jgi:phosphoribosyl-AMP cyclohydrolase / phosphoribosyl-ATP pyrophosphohydrolase
MLPKDADLEASGLAFDAQGLLPAVVQDRLTGQVRMVAWMNSESLARTLVTGRATFFSRSRSRLWEKGESSGNTLQVHAVYADCDGDTLLLQVDPLGPTCHTGRPNCFFRRVQADGAIEELAVEAQPFLDELTHVLQNRRAETAEKSYTRSLLEAGPSKVAGKVAEEARELGQALENESDDRVTNEAADLLYHLLVALELRGIRLRTVIEVLAKRAGVSGHAEKAARKLKSQH